MISLDSKMFIRVSDKILCPVGNEGMFGNGVEVCQPISRSDEMICLLRRMYMKGHVAEFWGLHYPVCSGFSHNNLQIHSSS